MHLTSATDAIHQEIAIRGSAEAVFAALTDPAQRMKWWGAAGRFQVTHMESDLRPGGKWSMSGAAVDHPFEVHGEYREVAPPRLLAFTWMPSWQGDATESLVRFDIEEKEGVTTVRLTHSGLSEAARNNHRGWPQILDWLRNYIEQSAD